MKLTLSGYIHAAPNYDGTSLEYHFWKWDQMDGEQMICPHTIEVEIGDPPDPLALAIADLQRQKEQAGREFAEKVSQLNERLAKLQAIGNNPNEVL